MRNSQKPGHATLVQIVTRLKDGRYVIPDFQRDFEWKPGDINALMQSIFRDYYIGSLLLWKGRKDNFDALSCKPVYGRDAHDNPEYIVLDGQQRLTALNYCVTAPDVPLTTRKSRYVFFVNIGDFANDNFEDAFAYSYANAAGKLLEDDERQFREHKFPLAVIGRDGWALSDWFRGHEKFWREQAATAEADGNDELTQVALQRASEGQQFGTHVRSIVEDYQISYIELDEELEIGKVCDIFTQINSRGIQLDIFDLMNALLKPKGIQLKHKWGEAKPKLSWGDIGKMNVYVLQVMSIFKQVDCSPKFLYHLLPGAVRVRRDASGATHEEILISDEEQFTESWDGAVAVLDRALRQLQSPQEYGAIKPEYIPYVGILPALAAITQACRQLDPQHQLSARLKIKQWYWASVFTNRYGSAVDTKSARDYVDVQKWFDDETLEPPVIHQFKDQFKGLDLHAQKQRGGSIYNGIFCMLVLNGAKDWLTGDPPQHDDLDDHHIIPASWGKQNLGDTSFNSILNRTPLTSQSNRHVISDRLPNQYLPELMARHGEGMVRSTLETHCISPAAFGILLRDPFTPEHFQEFIQERRRTLLDAIQNLLIEQRLDLTPHLRDLDILVHETEVTLRGLIQDVLANDVGNVPEHVVQKVRPRAEAIVAKDSSRDVNDLDDLCVLLEYFDLRELEAVLLSKQHWPACAERFGSKPVLGIKFGQLAELRNGIRHNRTVSQIVQKEGEAALLWFKEVLA